MIFFIASPVQVKRFSGGHQGISLYTDDKFEIEIKTLKNFEGISWISWSGEKHGLKYCALKHRRAIAMFYGKCLQNYSSCMEVYRKWDESLCVCRLRVKSLCLQQLFYQNIYLTALCFESLHLPRNLHTNRMKNSTS